jgi:hypothetical protein
MSDWLWQKKLIVFPPSYENMFDAWDNVPTTKKMFNNLQARLLKKEAMRKVRGLIEDVVAQTFFIPHIKRKMGRGRSGSGLTKEQRKKK